MEQYHFEKVANDLGLGGSFRWVLRFPPLFTTGYKSQLGHIMVEKVTIIKILKVSSKGSHSGHKKDLLL